MPISKEPTSREPLRGYIHKEQQINKKGRGRYQDRGRHVNVNLIEIANDQGDPDTQIHSTLALNPINKGAEDIRTDGSDQYTYRNHADKGPIINSAGSSDYGGERKTEMKKVHSGADVSKSPSTINR